MSIHIEVQDAHAQLLVEFYLNRLKTVKDEIVEREKETKNITGIIQTLKRGSASAHELNILPKADYSDKWPWVKKIQFAIEIQKKPLTTKEIVDTLSEYEPSFIFDRKRVVASISSILSTKSGDSREFSRVGSDSGEFAYVLNGKNEENKKYIGISKELEVVDDADLPF